MSGFLDLLAAGAAREELEQLVADAERRGDAGADALRADLATALAVRDQLDRRRTREAELAALYATAQDLTAMRDVQQVLQAIVRRARQLLGPDIAYLGLNVPADDAAYIQLTDCAVSASFRNLKLPLGTGLLGLVAQSGAPYATPDYHDDERFSHRDYIDDAVGDERIRAILGVPMSVGGQVLGALCAANRTPRPFPAEEVELLSSFAAHAAVALENARLFQETADAAERVREQSRATEEAAAAHDRLTGVLLRGGDAGDVAAALADSLGAAVTVRSDEGRVLTATAEPAAVTAGSVERARAGGRAVVDGAAVVAAAAAGGDHLATLVVVRATPLSRAEVRTVERAAVVTALLLLFARTVVEAADRVREDLLDDLLAGAADAAAVERLLERARRQGLDPAAPHVLLVAAGPGDDRRRAQALAGRLAAERQGIATGRGGDVVLLEPGDDPVGAGRRLRERLGGPTVGVAGPVPGLDALPAAYAEARQTVRALVSLGRTGEVSDAAGTGVARLLLGAAGPAETADLVRATIGPLLDHDVARGTDLAATVEAWFDAQGSATRAGRVLHVHTNTVAQRLERVDALLGASWREPARSLDVRMALHVHRLRRAAP